MKGTMMTKRVLWLLAALIACIGCEKESKVDCPIVVDARPGALQSDGSVTIFGAVRFAALSGSGGGGEGGASAQAPEGGFKLGCAELTVRAVYVAYQEVKPIADEFNFRSWTITLAPDRIASFDDGTRHARLPIKVYFYGGSVVELAEAQQPVVEVKGSVGTEAAGGGGAGGIVSSTAQGGNGGKPGG